MFNRLRNALAKSRLQILEGIETLIHGKKEIDQEVLDQLEERLIISEMGIGRVQAILEILRARLSRKELTDFQKFRDYLKQHLLEIIKDGESRLDVQSASPFVIMVVGVNGVGKTTTIAKIARRYQREGRTVLLAAGDTFRAAGIEQLSQWAERINVPVVRHETGSDPAAVLYDAVAASKARGIDLLLADTAGRLHTQSNLMEEIKKMRRVIQKAHPGAPHEVLLVLDATLGQNTFIQAKQFHESLGVTGIVLSKLDGSAKGGVLFAIIKDLGIPVRFIGVGEGLDDLENFNAKEFVEGLLD